MKNERQPLLAHVEPADNDHPLNTSSSPVPRPDLRSSPENALVDVQSEDDGWYFIFQIIYIFNYEN